MNFTVEPVAPAVVAVAGLPFVPAGLLLVTVAEQAVVVPVLYRFRVIGVATKTGLPEASWTWNVIAHVEPAVMLVVGVLVQVFAVIASLEAGPAAVDVAVLEPEVRPVDAAVTVQEPGTPVMVSVVVVELPPAAIVLDVGETLQTLPLSTENVTVVVAAAVVVTPFASVRVAVTVVVAGEPAGNALWPSDTASCVAAPGPVNVTFTVQPVSVGNVGEFADS